ncbi:zinc finger protein 106 isoform X3 [Melanotaenia boesemani]|uniref:zinc finger protein 106 isoform X3 n=1 Tax=Melanotaenia boesemani TaxID=1250792 RepID=UPI001C05318C|nr:zinc finger protein 106 isoform X3 [Melanotaenia boesemani]
MADVQPPQVNAPKTKLKKKYQQKIRNIYCILCRVNYLKHEAHEHMHSMLHHRELETVLGKDAFHDCQACKAKSLGLNEYAQHISTAQHKSRLKSLMTKNIKAPTLYKTLSKETIANILERNKTLKKEQKKAMRKHKKRAKQKAGQKIEKTPQGAVKKTTVASKGAMQTKYKQIQVRQINQMQQNDQERSNYTVFQNKENKVSSLQRPHHSMEFTQPNQTEIPVYQSGQPQFQHQQYVQHQFLPSAHHHGFNDKFSGANPNSQIRVDVFQTDKFPKRPYNYQKGATNMPNQTTWRAINKHNYNNRQNYRAADGEVASDQSSQNGTIMENTGSAEPEGSNCSGQPASANKSGNAAPIRDVDVGAMLKQIRRALGVREPCRADREARKQNSEGGVQMADHSTSQEAEAEQPAGNSLGSHVTSTPAAPAAGVYPPSIAPARSKLATFKKSQEITQYCEKSSAAVEGLSNCSDRDSQRSGKSSAFLTVQITPSELNSSNARKVRISHKSHTAMAKKEAVNKSTCDKLPNLSGDRNKLSWKEMYHGMKGKNARGAPRFGIQLVNHQTEYERFAQDSDFPLSEGFHWESVPDSSSGPQFTLPPSPTSSQMERQPDSQMQESLEQPDAAQMSCSKRKPTQISLKVEPNLEDEITDSRDQISTGKRKHSMEVDDGFSEMSTGQKKKAKSSNDQDQMDQLLAVSLREDEMSHSLQELEKSLIQARNTLQAAYSEVQRILLLKQQFTAEVNSLRAKRIEILQGLQEGYSGASNVAERATTSSAVPSPSLPSLSAFPTSSSQQPPTSTPTSSLTTLPLPAVSLKQEIYHADAPQAPLNQPAPLFTSNMLPSLLLVPSHLADPTAATASVKQPTAESSRPVNAPSPKSSAIQREQEKRDGLMGCVKTEVLEKHAQPAQIESVEETGGNVSLEQVRERESAANKSVPVREREDAHVDDEGNESDDSIEMVDTSNQEIIHIDESECEESPEANAPEKPEAPQKSVSVDFSSAGTQTYQQCETERKHQPSAMPANDANPPIESVEEKEPSLGAFSSHGGPVHGLQIHNGLLYTCSGDNTARAYSLVSKECQAVFEGHTNKINCLLVSSLPNLPARLYTGSSDQTIRCYSIKTKKCLEQIGLPDRVLCLHIGWNILYVGLASGSVVSYELKTMKELDVFECHGPRGVSCLGTAQEGARRLLLVGSYDSTISVRDAKSGLLLRSLEGHTKTVLCMKVVNDLVFSGSSDTSVHAHNIHTGELIRIYKGHGHAVTSIVILGKVMVTACLDKLVRVYELQSHDRLQVYGGHSDMVMCMAVHKSVIYTGCYDGSVQAVKLNLMKNHRCWWHGCCLIFGIQEHLMQHLIGDHSNPNLQTVKCRWRGCNTLFATQHSIRQELPEHMQSHIEEDSKLQP